MKDQIEIKTETPLLKPDGTLNAPGYCKRNLFIYNRENITAPKLRIKEWDFYQVSNGRYMVQICFANISLGAAGTAAFVDLKTGRRADAIGLTLGAVNRCRLPANGDKPYFFDYKKGNFKLVFDVKETTRTLVAEGMFKGAPLKMRFELEVPEGTESLTIATPFKKPNRFFYTQKLNPMPATGVVELGGEKIVFGENSFGVLDWGRGAWPYKNIWFWGNASARINGKLFGFELTWGFGDESYATETAIYYDGKCHKIGRVWVDPDPEGRWMEDWVFKSEDNRLNMVMKPFFDNDTGVVVLGLIGARCHQVHGLATGTAVLDDGTVLEFKDLYMFCEKMNNRW
ncbi:MAG: DUF2804 domain-containing protein [Christensenellales bacterium]|jgi:hypothetical protein|nr:DUF2804 domain-containing protein [Clostridia bacterium]HRU83808.1 DUF2804 domain-containing protein [Eubacteriales bacterium]